MAFDCLLYLNKKASGIHLLILSLLYISHCFSCPLKSLANHRSQIVVKNLKNLQHVHQTFQQDPQGKGLWGKDLWIQSVSYVQQMHRQGSNLAIILGCQFKDNGERILGPRHRTPECAHPWSCLRCNAKLLKIRQEIPIHLLH